MFPLGVALMVAAFVGVAAVPSAAAPVCSASSGVVTASLPADGDAAVIAVGTGTDAGRILFGVTDATAAPCGTATATNTDSIEVTGGLGAQTFRVSLAGGPFGPGATAETSGTSEIEFAVDLGDGGDDRLVVAGGETADAIVAGAAGVNVNGAENPDDVDVVLAGVEALDLEGAREDDSLSGNGGEGAGDPFVSAQLALRGGDGADDLTGGPGDDSLSGGADADQLDGGLGADTASYATAPSGVVVDLGSGSASGGDGADTVAAIENVTGSAFADTLTGDDGDNVIIGMGGDDAIEGLGGTDAARYLFATAGVVVNLAAGTATGADGSDVLSGIENVLGSAFDDDLRGDSGANQLVGASGNDSMSGAGGNDRFFGGDGDDRANGGAGNDGLFGQGGADDLRGGAGNDGLRGGAGDDALLGGPGNDVLRGGPMTDECAGGPGTDEIHSCEG